MHEFIIHEKIQGINIVKLSFNEITLEEKEELKKKLNNLIANKETKFIIDFTKVSILSSMIIAILMSFSTNVYKNGGEIKLCNMSNEILSVFSIMHLDRIFEHYPTVGEALASFSK